MSLKLKKAIKDSVDYIKALNNTNDTKPKFMDIQDLKVLAINVTAWGITLAKVEAVLSVVALAIGIGYTIQKWIVLRRDSKINRTK